MQSSKRQDRLDRRRSQQRQSQVRWLLYIAIGAVVLTVLLIFTQQLGGPRQTTYTQKAGISLGAADAPVVLTEYADFQCSFCQSAYNTTEEPIIKQYVEAGQVRFVFTPVGLLGPESISSAEAAYCAADQNYFWEYHDHLFAASNASTGNAGGYTEERLLGFARKINGLDVDLFTQCMAGDTKLPVIEAAFAEAQSFGITGTPSYVINGVVLGGYKDLPTLQQTIEDALTAAGVN
jgi:protein-disulfide isomerase